VLEFAVEAQPMNTPTPAAVFDFVERLYAAEVDDARFHFQYALRYAGREHSLHNATVHLQDAMNIRARLDVMRGKG
jgi:hypothetical protein